MFSAASAAAAAGAFGAYHDITIRAISEPSRATSSQVSEWLLVASVCLFVCLVVLELLLATNHGGPPLRQLAIHLA